MSSYPPGGDASRRAAAAAFLLLFLATLSGCASCRETGLAQLYFGRTMPDGSAVGDDAWADFLAAEVTPRFPDGFTVLDAHGQWRDPASGRVIAEPSKLLQIAGPANAETAQRIEAIRAAYRARFHQNSVGLVTASACVDFNERSALP